MAATWEFVGEYRPRLFDGDHGECGLCAGVNFSGWARQASSELSSSQEDWRVLGRDGVELLLAAAEDETEFLASCVAAGLECWTTGQLLIVSGMQHLVPELYSVYSTRNFVPTLPAQVASSIAETAMRRALRDLWSPREADNLPALGFCGVGPSVLHPLVHAAAQSYVAHALPDPRHIAAMLFVAHAEATTRCRSAVFHGQDSTRLGSSRFYYSRGDDEVRTGVPPVTLAGEVVRGCLLLGADPRALLRVARGFLERPPLGQGDAAEGTLVVAKREDLPFVTSRLAGLDYALALRGPALASKKGLVVTTAETLRDELSRRNSSCVRLRRWSRLVTVGWPDAQQVVMQSGSNVSFVFHLALSVYEDVDPCRDVYYEDLARLLGVGANGLSDPAAVRGVLDQRLMHLEEGRSLRASAKPSLRCSAVPVAEGSAAEEAALESFRGLKHRKRRFFGSLCGRQGHGFLPLPNGSTVVEHFSRKQPSDVLTSFAAENLREVGTPECPVCFEPDAPVATRCGHWFCEGCLEMCLQRPADRGERSRCPTCRHALNQRRDIVHTRPVPDDIIVGTAFMRQLRDAILGCEGRCIVVASHGEFHERLAKYLRQEGAVDTRAWRGRAQQLVWNLRSFDLGERAALLVDPAGPSLSWVAWPAVRRIFVLWPLEDHLLQRDDGSVLRSESCCQLRSVVRGLAEDAPAPEVVLFSRDPAGLPRRCSHREHWWCDYEPLA